MQKPNKVFWMKAGIYGPLIASILILIFGIQIPVITQIPLPGVFDFHLNWIISEVYCFISILVLISVSGYFYLRFSKISKNVLNYEGKKDED